MNSYYFTDISSKYNGSPIQHPKIKFRSFFCIQSNFNNIKRYHYCSIILRIPSAFRNLRAIFLPDPSPIVDY